MSEIFQVFRKGRGIREEGKKFEFLQDRENFVAMLDDGTVAVISLGGYGDYGGAVHRIENDEDELYLVKRYATANQGADECLENLHSE